MVTPTNYTKDGNYYGAVKLSGLSTDTKPTNVGNGSKFIEIDTQIVYYFDAENGDWYPKEET